ncbi:MAG: type II toxin-antitoxin system prevent-host-death family antitoxin [Clostridiales bacterium]|nr:type II toxin-antitoxin system prevent-host-death family antitoxin [Clostridiales bacterium]MCD8214228.1 type II toxin-antitoxin system prevent-host-death family antitoxin [Clostridiales bacterium]
MLTATATEVQNNFGKYLQLVQNGDEVAVMKNGKMTARIISYDKSVSYLTDSLIGVLKNDYDDKEMRAERMKKYDKNESVN